MTIWTRRSPLTKRPDTAAPPNSTPVPVAPATAAGSLPDVAWSGPLPRPPLRARLRRRLSRHPFKLLILSANPEW